VHSSGSRDHSTPSLCLLGSVIAAHAIAVAFDVDDGCVVEQSVDDG
jgi:hypothetical protein